MLKAGRCPFPSVSLPGSPTGGPGEGGIVASSRLRRQAEGIGSPGGWGRPERDRW